MEFKFKTAYNQEATTIMAKALRKTIRKRRSRRSHIFGVIVIVIALLFSLPLVDLIPSTISWKWKLCNRFQNNYNLACCINSFTNFDFWR